MIHSNKGYHILLDLPEAKCEGTPALPEALCGISLSSFASPFFFCQGDHEMTAGRQGAWSIQAGRSASLSLQTGERPRPVSTGCT